MKYLLTILCCSFCLSSVAQLSIGARTGPTKWLLLDENKKSSFYHYGRPPELRWDKELFGRYSVKRFSFEISINHHKQTSSYYHFFGDDYYYPMPNRYVSATTNSTENFFVANTLVQFNTNSWGKNKKLKNHIGLSLSPQYRHTKDITLLERADGTTSEERPLRFRHWEVWPGIDQSFTYDPNTRLQLSTHLFFRYYPTGPAAFKSANAQCGIHIGAAYKISP